MARTAKDKALAYARACDRYEVLTYKHEAGEIEACPMPRREWLLRVSGVEAELVRPTADGGAVIMSRGAHQRDLYLIAAKQTTVVSIEGGEIVREPFEWPVWTVEPASPQRLDCPA